MIYNICVYKSQIKYERSLIISIDFTLYKNGIMLLHLPYQLHYEGMQKCKKS